MLMTQLQYNAAGQFQCNSLLMHEYLGTILIVNKIISANE